MASGSPVHGIWVTTEGVATTELAVGLGLNFVVVDCEHGRFISDSASAPIAPSGLHVDDGAAPASRDVDVYVHGTF